MSNTIYCEKINEAYMKVLADPGIRQELSDYFSFEAPNFKFNPKYKARIWDGMIRLYSPIRPVMRVGLFDELKVFCNEYGYELKTDKNFFEYQDQSFSKKDLLELCKDLNVPFMPKEHQIQYILNAIQNGRSLALSPTSSGKSFIIYLIHNYYNLIYGYNSLVIVPSINLVKQMASDFVDYGFDAKDIHMISAGVEKKTSAKITISTWQSLKDQDKEWFEQFRTILGDEAHLFTAKSLSYIMDNSTSAMFRHGFTGTISSDSKVNRLELEGMFGGIKQYITTKELMDNGDVANLKIKAIVFDHSTETKELFSKAIKQIDKTKKFAAEREFLSNLEKRNKFIVNLVTSLSGQNNLILFGLVEKHGMLLKPMLEQEGRQLHFIHGGVSGDERERIRKLVENDPIKQHDILASFGTLSTGFSLKRLDNIIFASGSKSEVRVLQSIGRGLRVGNGSDNATLYDLADNLSIGNYKNYTLDHFEKRISIYSLENFDFKIYNVNL